MRYYRDGSTKSNQVTRMFRCGKCSQVLDEVYADQHENITWLKATEHNQEEDRKKRIEELESDKHLTDEEKEKKVDDIAKAEQHEKRIEEIKKSLRKLTSQELNDELEKLTAEIHELRKQLHPEEDEKKQSKQASVEFIGLEPQYHTSNGDYLLTGETPIKKSTYSILALEPYQKESVSGDSLLIRMGSTDEHTVGNLKGDSLLIQLGSVD